MDDEFPIQISKQVTPFQQVLFVQALKPERLVSAMESFVVKTLNLRELSPPALSLKHLYSETMETEPILIIISSGSDPSEELRDLATRFLYNNMLSYLVTMLYLTELDFVVKGNRFETRHKTF